MLVFKGVKNSWKNDVFFCCCAFAFLPNFYLNIWDASDLGVTSVSDLVVVWASLRNDPSPSWVSRKMHVDIKALTTWTRCSKLEDLSIFIYLYIITKKYMIIWYIDVLCAVQRNNIHVFVHKARTHRGWRQALHIFYERQVLGTLKKDLETCGVPVVQVILHGWRWCNIPF